MGLIQVVENDVQVVDYDYLDFQDRLMPRIVCCYSNGYFVIGQEAAINLGSLVDGEERVDRCEIVLKRNLNRFVSEQDLRQTQVIRLKSVDGVSLQNLYELVSDIHFHDFKERYFWLKDKSLWQGNYQDN